MGNDAGDPSTGQAVPLDPTTGSISSGQKIQDIAGTGALNGVTCPSITQCVATGTAIEAAGAATVILGAAPRSTPPPRPRPPP